MRKSRLALAAISFALWLFAAACAKSPVAVSVPPPPASVKPGVAVVSKPAILAFAIEPRAIEPGKPAMLRWRVKDADEVRIEPDLGVVSSSGHHELALAKPGLYTLVAKGLGGEATATARLEVIELPVAPLAKSDRTSIEQAARDMQDVYFDNDSASIPEGAQNALRKTAAVIAELLTGSPAIVVQIEGHADERGSAEYNLGIADRRAQVCTDFLFDLGIGRTKLRPVSYGKEQPSCTESTEDCWKQNRRVHFTPVVISQTTEPPI